ncbi:MAG: hypothetical protein ACXW32_02305 [Limisphaerales bacterium]
MRARKSRGESSHERRQSCSILRQPRAEYKKIYHKPERQSDLAKLRDSFAKHLLNSKVTRDQLTEVAGLLMTLDRTPWTAWNMMAVEKRLGLPVGCVTARAQTVKD